MTVEELKAEAAKLPLDERIAFTDWMASDREVLEARHAQLRAEIQKGIEQAERGETLPADEVFARLRGRLPMAKEHAAS